MLQGIWLPLITPFIDGSVDKASLARLAAHFMDDVDGFILAATTGEGMVLDSDETEHVVTTAAKVVRKRKPVYLGLCGSDTRQLEHRLRATADWPVDGYLITCPYYSRPSQEGMFQHFCRLAEATGRPVLIYNIPYRTGVNLANDTLLRLAGAIESGRLSDARPQWDRLVDLVRLLFAEPNPAPIKHLLWRRGLIASPELRLPMTGVSAALADRLEAWVVP